MSEQTQYKLEYKILFALVVAGKNAKFAERVTNALLAISHVDELRISPFFTIRRAIEDGMLLNYLQYCRSGNYGKLERAFKTLVESSIDLRLCTPQDLEKVPGIGPKTSRFFILWTRPDARFASLDTHILKWLKYLGYNAPKSTPTGKKYEELELAFLSEADKRKCKPVKLDYAIWEYCRDGGHKSGEWPEFTNLQ